MLSRIFLADAETILPCGADRRTPYDFLTSLSAIDLSNNAVNLVHNVCVSSITAAVRETEKHDGGDSERFWRVTGAGDASATKPE